MSVSRVRVDPAGELRPGLAFHRTSGSNTFDKLKVINRGTDTAYNVSLTFPGDASLELEDGTHTVEKIPGGGKSVTLDVWNKNMMLGGGGGKDAFDVTLTATTGAGESVTQEAFLDING